MVAHRFSDKVNHIYSTGNKVTSHLGHWSNLFVDLACSEAVSFDMTTDKKLTKYLNKWQHGLYDRTLTDIISSPDSVYMVERLTDIISSLVYSI